MTPSATPATDAARGPGRHDPVRIGVFVAVVLLIVSVVAAVAVGVHRLAADEDSDQRAHTVSGGVGGASSAEFELMSGATAVTVTVVELGGDAFRVRTGPDTGVLPRVQRSGHRVRLFLADDADRRGGPATVDIQLDRQVSWQLRLVGGATSETLDLGGGRISAVDLVGGVATAELTLPRPAGTATVQVTSGAGQVLLRRPGGIPARVTLAGGAGTAVLDEQTRTGVAAGTVIMSDGWSGATDRWDVHAVGGVSTLTVDRS